MSRSSVKYRGGTCAYQNGMQAEEAMDNQRGDKNGRQENNHA